MRIDASATISRAVEHVGPTVVTHVGLRMRFAAPATYSLLPYTELADGVWFPIGGMYRLVESLVAIAEAP